MSQAQVRASHWSEIKTVFTVFGDDKCVTQEVPSDGFKKLVFSTFNPGKITISTYFD